MTGVDVGSESTALVVPEEPPYGAWMSPDPAQRATRVEAWLRDPGATVVRGEPVVQLTDDVATYAVHAPVTGRLGDHARPVGASCQPGDRLGEIRPMEVDPTDLAAATGVLEGLDLRASRVEVHAICTGVAIALPILGVVALGGGAWFGIGLVALAIVVVAGSNVARRIVDREDGHRARLVLCLQAWLIATALAWATGTVAVAQLPRFGLVTAGVLAAAWALLDRQAAWAVRVTQT